MYLVIYNLETGKCFKREFDDYRLFRNLYYRVKYSKKLTCIECFPLIRD